MLHRNDLAHHARAFLALVALAALTALTPATAVAQSDAPIDNAHRDVSVGIHGGAWFPVDFDDPEPLVGVDVRVPVGESISVVPGFEWVFVDLRDIAFLNVDLHYDLTSEGERAIWIGTGLGLRYFGIDLPGADGEWDPGLDLIAGAAFGHGGFIPYVQARYFVSEVDNFVLAAGVRF